MNAATMNSFQEQLLLVMEAHFHQDSLKATSLHKLLKMSRSSLHHKLKSHFNMTVSLFITKFRTAKAIELLQTSKDPVKAIAFQVGYRDPNYFSRVFKKETGVAPGEFRKRNAQN